MSKSISINQKNSQLWQDYQDKKIKTSMLFPTEGAKILGVSEFELLLASPYSRYMGSNCADVLNAFTQFGVKRLESIVRNDNAVHEKIGTYQNLKLSSRMGLMLNVGGLDLRYFIHKWRHVLAVDDISNPQRPIHSIQFFDGQGNAINKVYLKDIDDDMQAWQALIDQQIKTLTDATLTLEPLEQQTDWQLKQLSTEDTQTLHDKWLAMTDVHQFFGILQSLELDRASSYAQAPNDMAQRLQPQAVESFLQAIKNSQCPIMIFVGNTGVVQIQTGTVKTIKRMGEWINILDKDHNDFTMHLKDSAITQLWCVKRPISEGVVTSVEAFDEYGDTIVTIFGQRQEGQPELEDWVNLTDHLTETFGI